LCRCMRVRGSGAKHVALELGDHERRHGTYAKDGWWRRTDSCLVLAGCETRETSRIGGGHPSAIGDGEGEPGLRPLVVVESSKGLC
jgi:hypothetical protein